MKNMTEGERYICTLEDRFIADFFRTLIHSRSEPENKTFE